MLLGYLVYMLRHVLILFIGRFMFLVEMGVAFLQSCIFTGLLLYYVYEVPFKLKEDS